MVGLITAASYAGTSNLFAAYLSGASISWWDSDVQHLSDEISKACSKKHVGKSRDEGQSEGGDAIIGQERHTLQPIDAADNTTGSTKQSCGAPPDGTSARSGKAIFENFYSQPLQRILKPFFFASIGFSVPISKMFTGTIVWRGVIYTILMCVGKLVCGLWLLRISRMTYNSPQHRRAKNEKCGKEMTQPEQGTRAGFKNPEDGLADKTPPKTGGLATPPPEPEPTSPPDSHSTSPSKVAKPVCYTLQRSFAWPWSLEERSASLFQRSQRANASSDRLPMLSNRRIAQVRATSSWWSLGPSCSVRSSGRSVLVGSSEG